MKNRLTATTALALLSILFTGVAQADEIPSACQGLMKDISRKIVRNGIPATDFKLRAVPKDNVDRTKDNVVGNCGFGAYSVVYVRGSNINSSAGTTTSVRQSGTVAVTPAAVAPKVEQSSSETAKNTTNLVDTDNTASAIKAEQLVSGNAVEISVSAEVVDSIDDKATPIETDSVSSEVVNPAKPQPEIIITSPENDPDFQSKMADANSSIIIHR